MVLVRRHFEADAIALLHDLAGKKDVLIAIVPRDEYESPLMIIKLTSSALHFRSPFVEIVRPDGNAGNCARWTLPPLVHLWPQRRSQSGAFHWQLFRDRGSVLTTIIDQKN
jgi:hypothetical protein